VAKINCLHRKRIPAGKGADEITPAGVRWQNFAVCVFLVLLVAAVFGQTVRFEFINYDDNENVYENPVVEKGLSRKGISWAFTDGENSPLLRTLAGTWQNKIKLYEAGAPVRDVKP
jgi:hypothetical protein